MSPLDFTLVAFFASVGAGLLGSLLGLGGGIIVIPVLTLLLGVDMRFAIGASVISVIATSSGAAAAYVKEHMANIRVAMFLELGTTAGALTGAYVGGLLSPKWLFIIFAVVLGYSAYMMISTRHADPNRPIPKSRMADSLRLHDAYYDEAEKRVVHYKVTRPSFGLIAAYVAGTLSGLLGIGGGAINVPSMDLIMRLPIKVTTSTSNVMIGVTAAASAGVYFARGQINPFVTAPVAIGVLCGATAGSKLLPKIHSKWVRLAFVLILCWISIQMLLKGIHYQEPVH